MAALALLTLLSANPSAGAGAEGTTTTAGEAAALENAISFRQMFGLDADIATVQRAASSADSRRSYGPPLSAAEEAELGRRAQVEEDSAAGAAFGRTQSTWGGYYFDQLADGVPVFLFTDRVELMRSQLAGYLPSGMDFRVEPVTRSLEQLQATKDAIIAAYDELRAVGTHVTSAGLDISENQVVVGIDGLTEAAQKDLALRFGDSLRFEERKPAQSDACPATNCRPLKGGIKIVGVPTGLPCTSGFVVRRAFNNQLAFLTAGHCLWVQNPDDPSLRNWYHVNTSANPVNDQFGESLFHTFVDPPGSLLTEGDVGLIDLWANEEPATRNRIYTDLGGGTVHPVTGFITDQDQTEGSQVCAYGYASDVYLAYPQTAYYCTTITRFDETMQSCAQYPGDPKVCYDIMHTNVYAYNMIGGDSGGPIFKRPNPVSINVSMMGTHVHSLENNNAGPPYHNQDGWYTPYGWGRFAYITRSGAPSGDNYSLCITSSC